MNLTELHQTAVAAAEALRAIQAQAVTEREASEDGMTCSRETRQAQKEASRAYDRAMSKFQNEVDALGVQNVPNLKELYAQIGQVKIYA